MKVIMRTVVTIAEQEHVVSSVNMSISGHYDVEEAVLLVKEIKETLRVHTAGAQVQVFVPTDAIESRLFRAQDELNAARKMQGL